MMRSGKDYITKAEPEEESPRAIYLRELLLAVAPQAEVEVEKTEAEPLRPVNQSKPTLKLAK